MEQRAVEIVTYGTRVIAISGFFIQILKTQKIVALSAFVNDLIGRREPDSDLSFGTLVDDDATPIPCNIPTLAMRKRS